MNRFLSLTSTVSAQSSSLAQFSSTYNGAYSGIGCYSVNACGAIDNLDRYFTGTTSTVEPAKIRASNKSHPHWQVKLPNLCFAFPLILIVN